MIDLFASGRCTPRTTPRNLSHDQYNTSSRPVNNSDSAFKLIATSASPFRVLSHPPCRAAKMAEAIGAASSILALTIFAYNTSKSLYEAVSSFKSQRKTIKDVQTDLGALVAVLGLVREQAQGSEDDTQVRTSPTADAVLHDYMSGDAGDAECMH